MKKPFAPILLLTAALALSACGANKTDRALGGAAIGAGTGVLVGSMVGAPGEGALIGASVGAATGALTEIDMIDLGKPWWK
jgi:osmotically inducible lipoprotein OsmB